MKKYFLTSTGKQVKEGDILVPLFIDEQGKEQQAGSPIKIDSNTIPILLKNKVISEQSSEVADILSKSGSGVPLDLTYYIQILADKMGWKFEKTLNYLETLDSIDRSIAFSIVLKLIAIELDKKYPDHIQHSPEIYGIAITNGTIIQLNKAKIKNYKHFAAFRTIADAKVACSILRDVIKDMFKQHGK